MVEYAVKSSNQWATVSTQIKPEQRRLVIPGLKPGTWYKLRMTAHNTAGSTIATYDFATLTTTGGTVAPDIQMDSSGEQIDGLMAALNFYVIIPIACTFVILIAIFGLACVCVSMKKREIQARNAANQMTDYYQSDYDAVSYIQRATMQRNMATSKQYNALDEIAPYATLPLHREYHGACNSFNEHVINQQFVIPHGFGAGSSQTETTFTFPDPPPDAFQHVTDNRNEYENDRK
ncbi:Down syndrome cell adhesion molecule-like protein 1 [Chamberlinius hualienensis]